LRLDLPFGTVQEWFGKIGKRIFKRKYNNFIPYAIDRWLRYARYLVLAWIVYVTATSATLWFADYDPYFALFNFWTSEVAVGGLVVLGVTLAASLLVDRPWCKYACPYGAVLGVTNLFRVFSIRRNEGTCKLDGACNRACLMNIPVSSMKVVRHHQCISCMECTTEASVPLQMWLSSRPQAVRNEADSKPGSHRVYLFFADRLTRPWTGSILHHQDAHLSRR
jgi:polyferredoxin